MAKIFVNYRREDDRAAAARIHDRLAGVFGSSNVFLDVDDLLPGQRFDKELDEALARTEIFVAVIGPRWMQLLSERQAAGGRDYVREEIAGALARGIPVIPVLIERASLPRQAELDALDALDFRWKIGRFRGAHKPIRVNGNYAIIHIIWPVCWPI